MSKKSGLTSKEVLKGLEENNLEHYVIAYTKINGKSQKGVVMLTASEYQAIKDWFESVKQIKPENEAAKETVAVTEKYAEEIAKAKELGRKVIIKRYARDSENPESDTEIVTVYIDSDGNITQNIELMD